MAALLALLLLPLATAGEPRAFVLDNGLRVAVLEEHRAPLVAVQLLVAAGAADEPEGLGGAAHLLEHALFTGSSLAPDRSFDQALGLGADANAWTHLDWTGFTTLVPPGALERALALEADRLGAPELDPATVERELRVVLAEAAGLYGVPHGADAAVLARLLYPEHPYGRELTGLGAPGGEPGLVGLDAAALRAFHTERYAPARCVLVVAGDLDGERAEAWIRARFGAIPRRDAVPRGEEPAPELLGEQRWVSHDDVGVASLYAGWRGVPRWGDDEAAHAVLAWLLSHDDELSGALEPLGVEHEAWSDSYRLGGSLVVALRSREDALEPALHRVDRALRRLAREGPTPGALERARGAWSHTWLRAADPVAGQAALAAQCLATGAPMGCADDELARYRAVGASDIQRVAAALSEAPGRVLLSVVSPEGGPAALPGSVPVEAP